MKLTLRSLTLLLVLCHFVASSQVRTNKNNTARLTAKGQFNKNYQAQVDYEIPAKNIEELEQIEKRRIAASSVVEPFQLAVPVAVDLDIPKLIRWNEDGAFVYGKFTIKLNKALSSSINFDRFYLPKETEMYIYNENGEMITGPVTENENNTSKIWGSWVYKGEFLTIEIKVPKEILGQLELHSNNIAYGYKKVYQVEAVGYGQSAACEINVLCALGTLYGPERNSVALILSDDGRAWCSGAAIMNTCGNNTPYFLTANHCFDPPDASPQNVGLWRFTFQTWSPTCSPSQNSDGITFNGSTLRANWDGTDFCLVELNDIPPANSGISYAGWNRNTSGITQTTIIHHPAGDVMKITRDDDAPTTGTFAGANCWHLQVDEGATEGGTSGAPYFDDDHRIIGQHYGVDDAHLAVCDRASKFGGRFDLSWAGNGTSGTRLSNWLDPAGSAAMTTNTTPASSLFGLANSPIVGPDAICNTADYSVPNLPAGSSVTWAVSGGGPVLVLAHNTPSTNQLRITNQHFYQISTTLTATITNGGTCFASPIVLSKTISNDNGFNNTYNWSQESCSFYDVLHPAESGTITTNGAPVFVHQGCFVSVPLSGLPSGATVTFVPTGSAPVTQPLFWGFIGGTLTFQLPLGSGGIPFEFRISTPGACFDRDLLFFSITDNNRYAFTATPNPAIAVLTITAKENGGTNDKARFERPLEFITNIYDFNTNALIMTKRNTKGSKQQQINVSSLRTGYYVLQIIDGDEIKTIKFFKE